MAKGDMPQKLQYIIKLVKTRIASLPKLISQGKIIGRHGAESQ